MSAVQSTSKPSNKKLKKNKNLKNAVHGSVLEFLKLYINNYESRFDFKYLIEQSLLLRDLDKHKTYEVLQIEYLRIENIVLHLTEALFEEALQNFAGFPVNKRIQEHISWLMEKGWDYTPLMKKNLSPEKADSIFYNIISKYSPGSDNSGS